MGSFIVKGASPTRSGKKTNNGHVVSKRASYDKRCMRLMFNSGEIK